MMTTVEIIDRLEQATADLLWVSESDYPFEIVTWMRDTEMTPTVLFKESIEVDTEIEIITLADFFAPAFISEDWYGESELATLARYQDLVNSIESNLTEVQVFRIGEVEVTIYIIGKTPNGDIVGLKTQVVET